MHTNDDAGPLRLLQIVAGLDPIFGGPSYSVPRLATALAAVGAEVTVLSVAAADAEPRGQPYADRRFAQSFAHVPGLRGLRSSTGFSAALRDAAKKTNIVHGHGLWLWPNVETGWAAAAAGTPLVVSPRGMLSPAALRFSRWKKRAFWHALQGSVVRRAACLHATSEQEYEELRAFGLSAPVAVIHNGIDLPPPAGDAARPPDAARLVLALGRLHPKKGLDTLLRSWAAVEPSHADWHLRIVGPSEDGYANDLCRMAVALGVARVQIEGPVYGAEKWDAYRGADLFVLPSLNENFGLTVAEALAAGTPAIASRGTPWYGLESEGCGWWVDHDVEALAAALRSVMAMPRGALRGMGDKGRAWMARDFSWDHAAHDMSAVYRWLVDATECPAVVRLA